MHRPLAVLAAWLLSATAHAAGPTMGQHGMALFGGKQGLYASHLPMFHAPHDYQVVFSLRLADPALERALRARLDGKTALWTVAPEHFELDRLAPRAARPLRRFKADLVLGHFEQGGATQYRAATVLVERVLLFRRLSGSARASNSARYLQLGSGSQRYLVKEIDSRPDFDHIVSVTAGAGVPNDAISVPRQALQEPAPRALAAALPGATVNGSIYFYTEDLR